MFLFHPVRSDGLHWRQVRRAIAAGECAGWDQADLLEMLIVSERPLAALKSPEPPSQRSLSGTLRIIYHTLRLVSLLFLCIYWISCSAVLLLRPQISSPSLAYVSPPRLPMCIVFLHPLPQLLRLSDGLSIVLTVHDFHLENWIFFVVDAWVVCYFYVLRCVCCGFFFCPELHRLSLH